MSQLTLCNLVTVIEFFSDSSGNSVISVKGKGLTNVKMYVEGKVFSKGKI